ncbi:FAD-dependent oxidoreductase [Streptomyces sp. RB6PN25]|uniref:FAD-dependent oxidoreductase n=1 Tax=Streptomyces humicola TaxID=2953240 RepID=A0ABT1PQM1_9ACTN|nr:FAD-dependent oxidoreductase [Streptomyces humicola]MCQ4079959.1 FAD-dependent oxidoreductase [Streptomyces humicola]
MSTAPRHVLVVGASIAGLTAAETLRREGYDGLLTLIGDEPHLPYDRPPLSKQILTGAWEPSRAALRSSDEYDRLGIDVLTARRATALDPGRRTVELDDGERIAYDGLVIATGVRPRRLPTGHGLDGVHVLRTLDDTLRLRDHLLRRPRITVVGAGFTGTEVAAGVRTLGLDTTLICPGPAPLAGRLGPVIGHLVGRLHADHGVRLRTGVGVTSLTGSDGHVTGLELTDGSHVDADAVVVAIGSTPATDWLRGSGLDVTDGVVCDAYCRAAPGIYAAGDVARWHDPRLGTPMRREHRTNAAEQAIAAARNLLGAREPYAPLPYFWTDQYGDRIQAYGICSPGTEPRIVHGSPAEGSFVALYGEDGHVTGALGWNSARQLRTYARQLIQEPVAAAR